VRHAVSGHTLVEQESFSHFHTSQDDVVNSPSHYQTFPDMEAIDIIRSVLTIKELKGYLKGNFLKYKLRAGAKINMKQDIEKAQVYQNWLFECIDEEEA